MGVGLHGFRRRGGWGQTSMMGLEDRTPAALSLMTPFPSLSSRKKCFKFRISTAWALLDLNRPEGRKGWTSMKAMPSGHFRRVEQISSVRTEGRPPATRLHGVNGRQAGGIWEGEKRFARGGGGRSNPPKEGRGGFGKGAQTSGPFIAQNFGTFSPLN